MKSLPQLQDLFFHSVINCNDGFEGEVVLQGEMSAQERVSIYVDAYRLRLIEAMQDSYSALHTLMGDEDFEALCLKYIDHYPSAHFSIRYFGQYLAEYLENVAQMENSELLAEMAKFEWVLRTAFDAKDQAVLTLNNLADVAPEQWPTLTFKVHASLQVLSLSWNVPILWKAIEQEAEPQAPQRKTSPQQWVVWRPLLETQFRSMEGSEAEGFLILQQGGDFAALCELMNNQYNADNAAQQAANYLGTWINEGLFTVEGR